MMTASGLFSFARTECARMLFIGARRKKKRGSENSIIAKEVQFPSQEIPGRLFFSRNTFFTYLKEGREASRIEKSKGEIPWKSSVKSDTCQLYIRKFFRSRGGGRILKIQKRGGDQARGQYVSPCKLEERKSPAEGGPLTQMRWGGGRELERRGLHTKKERTNLRRKGKRRAERSGEMVRCACFFKEEVEVCAGKKRNSDRGVREGVSTTKGGEAPISLGEKQSNPHGKKHPIKACLFLETPLKRGTTVREGEILPPCVLWGIASLSSPSSLFRALKIKKKKKKFGEAPLTQR